MYVTRSMSRAGTPIDNGAMESINGWIKAELFMDFYITGDRPVETEIDEYITFFNEQRPAYALNYLTPKQYRVFYDSLRMKCHWKSHISRVRNGTPYS